MTGVAKLRRQLARCLDWKEAHAGVEDALARFPPELRGKVPHDLPYSAWQLLEHMRIAQRDIVEFCRDRDYEAPAWPDDYWPPSPEPPYEGAWDRSLAAFREDLESLKSLATDSAVDLFAVVPTGEEGQTYLRALLLVADHNAYHAGQVVVVRRLLGIWPPELEG